MRTKFIPAVVVIGLVLVGGWYVAAQNGVLPDTGFVPGDILTAAHVNAIVGQSSRSDRRRCPSLTRGFLKRVKDVDVQVSSPRRGVLQVSGDPLQPRVLRRHVRPAISARFARRWREENYVRSRPLERVEEAIHPLLEALQAGFFLERDVRAVADENDVRPNESNLLHHPPEPVVSGVVARRLPARSTVLPRSEAGPRLALDVVSGPANISKNDVPLRPEARELGFQIPEATGTVDERVPEERDSKTVIRRDHFGLVR